MSVIPADLVDAACEAWKKIGELGNPQEMIAKALMAERERCAMIVEDSVFKIGGIYAQNIAAAIRRGTP